MGETRRTPSLVHKPRWVLGSFLLASSVWSLFFLWSLGHRSILHAHTTMNQFLEVWLRQCSSLSPSQASPLLTVERSHVDGWTADTLDGGVGRVAVLAAVVTGGNTWILFCGGRVLGFWATSHMIMNELGIGKIIQRKPEFRLSPC